jgi:hypothetical protein
MNQPWLGITWESLIPNIEDIAKNKPPYLEWFIIGFIGELPAIAGFNYNYNNCWVNGE